MRRVRRFLIFCYRTIFIIIAPAIVGEVLFWLPVFVTLLRENAKRITRFRSGELCGMKSVSRCNRSTMSQTVCADAARHAVEIDT